MWLQGSAETQRASFWTRNTHSTNESLVKRVSRSTKKKKRKKKKPAWEAQEGFSCSCCVEQLPPTVEPRLLGQFTADIRTPSSNLTAEVEWWQGSSRVPCSIHGILMAAKQRPQELGLFYKPGSILLSTAPRWHAITHMVFTLDSYFLDFLKPHFLCRCASLPAEFLNTRMREYNQETYF